MLTSISPLGERARGNRYWRTAAAYLAGSLLGGAAVGALLGAAGSLAVADLDAAVRFGVIAVAAVAGVALDAAGRVPTIRRQVDERWLSTYRGWVYGAGFGAQLGTGVATIVTASTTYVALLAAFLTGSTAGGVAVGATFGIARALPLLLTARVRSTDALARLHRQVAGAAGGAARLTSAAQLAVAAVAAVAAFAVVGAA
jgi:hypothetical protein